MFPLTGALKHSIPEQAVRRKLHLITRERTNHRAHNLYWKQTPFRQLALFLWVKNKTLSTTGRIPARKHFHTLDSCTWHLSDSWMGLHICCHSRIKLWLASCRRRNTQGHIQWSVIWLLTSRYFAPCTLRCMYLNGLKIVEIRGRLKKKMKKNFFLSLKILF